jgi:hypothetical protein
MRSLERDRGGREREKERVCGCVGGWAGVRARVHSQPPLSLSFYSHALPSLSHDSSSPLSLESLKAFDEAGGREPNQGEAR